MLLISWLISETNHFHCESVQQITHVYHVGPKIEDRKTLRKGLELVRRYWASNSLAKWFTHRINCFTYHYIHCIVQPVWFCCDMLQILAWQCRYKFFQLVAQIKICQYLQKYQYLPLEISSSKLFQEFSVLIQIEWHQLIYQIVPLFHREGVMPLQLLKAES